MTTANWICLIFALYFGAGAYFFSKTLEKHENPVAYVAFFCATSLLALFGALS